MADMNLTVADVVHQEINQLHTVRALLAGSMSICDDHQGDPYSGDVSRITREADRLIDAAIDSLDRALLWMDKDQLIFSDQS